MNQFIKMSISNEIELQKVCRTCLSASADMKSSLYDIYSDAPQITFAEMLMSFTPLKLSENDGLPTHICCNCMGELNRFNVFQIKCRKSDTILRNCVNKQLKSTNKSHMFVETSTKNITELNDKSNSCVTMTQIDDDFEVVKHEIDVNIKTEVTDDSSYHSINDVVGVSRVTDHHHQSNNIEASCTTIKDPLEITESEQDSDRELNLEHVKIEMDNSIECGNQLDLAKITEYYNKFNRNATCSRNVQTNVAAIEKPYSCPDCDCTFKQKIQLKVHMRQHSGEKAFACTVCNSLFKRKSYLTVHMRTHTGEKPYSCTVCERSFVDKSALTVHMRKHTGEKPFSCTVCDKSFNQNVTLTAHMRKHNGERPFACNVCDLSFKQNPHLISHMRTHTMEKPYLCTFCDSSFNQKICLTRHLRLHTGEKPYSCTVCDSSFNQNISLTRHMRRHTGEKPFVCTWPACGKAFTQNSNLVAHMRKHAADKHTKIITFG